jgi:hypothetical protein
MKFALRLLLSAALLLQGAMAVAMPLAHDAPAAHASAEAAMPCHGGAKSKAPLPCCPQDGSSCPALCSAPALPAAVPQLVLADHPDFPPVALRVTPSAPHRYTPLRPPIGRSA